MLLNCVGLLLGVVLVPIVQAVEHWSCKPQVPGSIPGGDWHFSLRTYWLPFLLLNLSISQLFRILLLL